MSEANLKSRLVAILAADATGYSRLMSLDERATVAALDAARAVFRTQIEGRQGRVIDMAGDSVLAVFGTAAGAVSAALAIQTEVGNLAEAAQEDRRMRFRIGIHLGDVIEKADGTVYGDGVNIAARLEGLAEPGGISVSDGVYGAVRGKVAAAFEDQGEQTVKNIAHPVRAWRVRADGAATSAPVTGPQPTATVVEIDLSLPDKPSIAVLPFTNMSGDPEQEYFTDGISEDIITELSRFESLFVIARNSSFTYKGRAVDIKQVGRELGVRYVLEGSIRKAANRIRVTAQLIDTLSGSHVWAEKYDRVLEDIFAVQEEVTECIVGAMALQVDAAESLRMRRRPGNLSAYELAVRGLDLAINSQEKTDLVMRNEALRLGREALALDPQSVQALEVIAYAQWQHSLNTPGDRKAAWQEAMDAAMRGIALGQSIACHGMRAQLLACAPGGARWDEARIEAQLTWRLNPQHAMGLTGSGYILANAGEPREAIRLLERMLRISPRNPHVWPVYTNLANAHLALRQYAEGIEWGRQAIHAGPDYVHAFMVSAALHVGLGDLASANAAMRRAIEIQPALQNLLSRQSPREAPHTPNAGTESRQRQHTFMRIAAGLEAPGAAVALR